MKTSDSDPGRQNNQHRERAFDAGSAGAARHRAKPRRVLPGPGVRQLLLDACPAIVENMMERFAALTGRRYRLFDYVGDPRAERVIMIMGSGAETVDETMQYLTERGKKVASSREIVPAVLLCGAARGAADHHPLHRRPRSHEGAWCGRRSALSGHRVRAHRGARRPKTTLCLRAACRCGPLWPVVEGITPAMVRQSSTSSRKTGRATTSLLGLSTMSRTPRSIRIRRSTEAEDVDTALFYGLAHGTVGANKNRSKSSARKPTVTSRDIRLRFQKIGRDYDLASARQPPPDPLGLPHHQRQVRRLPSVRFRRQDRRARARRCRRGVSVKCSGSAAWRVGTPAARTATADDREKNPLLRHRRVRGGQGNRHGQPHQHDHANLLLAISGVLPREEAIAKIKKAIEKTYGKMGADTYAGTSRRSIRPSRGCTRFRCPAR